MTRHTLTTQTNLKNKNSMGKTQPWKNFNDAANDKEDTLKRYDVSALKSALLARLSDWLSEQFPKGKARNQQFFIGDVEGNTGNSLVVELVGAQAGLWIDFATEDKGDVIDLWAATHRLDSQRDFVKILEGITDWLGENACSPSGDPSHVLGKPSAQWDYHDAKDNIIATVYRYDTAKGKTYRPWDAKTKQYKAPAPRPLYNLPQLIDAKQVILVEGEKAAQALIEQGIVATTAMSGANAPVDKTNWLPLKGKEVLIWPDHDQAGLKYAKRAAQILLNVAKSVIIGAIPKNRPVKWDASDAVQAGEDIHAFIEQLQTTTVPFHRSPWQLTPINPAVDWVGQPPEREWIIPDWLPKGYVTALYGDGGVGKSLLAQQLITAVSTGTPWLEIPVQQRKVYGLLCEDDAHELWRRQWAINHQQRIAMQQLVHIRLWSRVGRNNLLMTFDGKDTGQLTAFFDELLQEILDFGAELTVLDTAADLFGGNENNRSHVRQFIQTACAHIARETGGAVLLCAHPSDSGMIRGTGTGGSTAWSNTVRSRWYLTHDTREGAPPNQRILSRRKSNYSAAYEDIDLAWESGNLIRIHPDATPVIQHPVSRQSMQEKARKRRVMVELIRQQALQGQLYNTSQLARAFQNSEHRLGCERSIKELVAVMTTQGELQFTRDGKRYGLNPVRQGHGYLCQNGMPIKIASRGDSHGENSSTVDDITVEATHCIDPPSGELVPYVKTHTTDVS